MRIGIYDGDIYQPRARIFPNLEAMKLSAFYKKQGAAVELLSVLSEREISKYDKVFIVKDRIAGKLSKTLLSKPNVHFTGLYFSNGVYVPLSPQVEVMVPDTTLYFPYLRQKLAREKFTEKEVENYIGGAYIRIFYEDWVYKYTVNPKQFVTLYDLDITSNPTWREAVDNLYQMSGRKIKILHPVVARTMDDLTYLCEVKPFFSDRPTRIIIDMDIVETDFKNFLLDNKTLLQNYGGQMLFMYMNKFYHTKVDYKEYIISMINKIFLARNEGVKLNLLFLRSDFYNPYDVIMETVADWFYMQPNKSLYEKLDCRKELITRTLIEEIVKSPHGADTFLTNLSIIKEGGNWDYDEIRVKTKD